MWTSVSTLGDVVDRQADRNTGTATVIDGERLSYPELSERTDRFAASLIGLGVNAGDRIGILMPNCLDFIVALVASAKIGAISVPINGRFKLQEAGYVIDHADLTVLLTSRDNQGTDFPALVAQVVRGATRDAGRPSGSPLRDIVNFSYRDQSSLDRDAFDRAGDNVTTEAVKVRQSRVRVRDIALLMYTSGTTARPKGCLLTHEAISRQGEKIAKTRLLLTPDDAFWDPLPLFHCGGIVPMFGTFSAGATYCHAGHFDPGDALRVIAAEKCTVLYPSFEAIWLSILNHRDFDTTDLSHVRVIQNIATPERMAQYENRMPWAKQVTSYGSTECATNLTMGHPDDPLEVRISTLGRVVEGMEVKIVDPETGDEVPRGTMGELCFRGYSCFEGYYKDPVQTAAAFDADGFFHSGDRASVDSDGIVRFGGRLKDMLKIGGENAAAIEIEDFLSRHEAIRVVQIVGVPDEKYGEVAAAFVELNSGHSLTTPELQEFCVGSIATYKIPRYMRTVSEWPMSGTKIKKFELRDALARELADAGIVVAPPVRSQTSTPTD
ncbi:fatty-acyl-CoA synthase [Williamsia muralis]|nr:fatty-acyl-CoA synthase [Williamsia marianensis]